MMLSQMEEVATSFNLARESDGEEGGTGRGGTQRKLSNNAAAQTRTAGRAGRGRGVAQGAGRRGSNQGGGSGLRLGDQHPVDQWLKVKAPSRNPSLGGPYFHKNTHHHQSIFQLMEVVIE